DVYVTAPIEMDSVIAAARPVTIRTWVGPPAATTPRTMPSMLTRPSCPPRIMSRKELLEVVWSSFCGVFLLPGIDAWTAFPSGVVVFLFIFSHQALRYYFIYSC